MIQWGVFDENKINTTEVSGEPNDRGSQDQVRVAKWLSRYQPPTQQILSLVATRHQRDVSPNPW